MPKASYFAALTVIGVDVLFVLTGARTPIRLDNLSAAEQHVLNNFRSLPLEDQDAVKRITGTLARLTYPLLPAALVVAAVSAEGLPFQAPSA